MGEIKSIWINKQVKDISFCRHLVYNLFQDIEQIFSVSQPLASSMLPTTVTPAIMDAFSQYETLRFVFIGDASFSFMYVSSAMISVWHNLHSDLTFVTSSDDKTLSTVGKTFSNTLFKALDTWSVRLEILPNVFVLWAIL